MARGSAMIEAGGEALWYNDHGCGFVTIPGIAGETYMVWAENEPSVTGDGDGFAAAAGGPGVWQFEVSSSGEINLEEGGPITAHGPVDMVYTECA